MLPALPMLARVNIEHGWGFLVRQNLRKLIGGFWGGLRLRRFWHRKGRLRRNGLFVWHGFFGGPGSAQSTSESKDRLKQNPAYGPPANAVTPDVRKDTRGHHRFRLRNVSSAESLHLSVRATFRSCGLSGLDVRSLHALGSLGRFEGYFLTFLK